MKIKSLLLLGALLANNAYAETDNFYLRLKLSRLHPEKIGDLVAKPVILPGMAIGYNISDDMRVDLSFSHLTNVKHKGKITESVRAPGNLPPTYTDSLKEQHLLPPTYNRCDCPPIFIHSVKPVLAKAKLTTCKVNLFVDIYKVDNMSLYVGGGVGITRIERSMTIDNVTEKFSPYYTPSYDLHTGINHHIGGGIHVGIGYTFKNLTENTYNYKGHSIATTLKIDL